jgi:hypothetical protein
MKVLITGASGSGTTTLGQALAEALSLRHFDTDDYYWLPTHPPYQQKRSLPERLLLLRTDIQAADRAVVSGSVMGWGADIENSFDLIVFLYLPASIRIERLHQREVARYGAVNPEFLAWAAQYDAGTAEGRSLAKHEAWFGQRSCPILHLDQDISVSDRVTQILKSINLIHHLPSRQTAINGS